VTRSGIFKNNYSGSATQCGGGRIIATEEIPDKNSLNSDIFNGTEKIQRGHIIVSANAKEPNKFFLHKYTAETCFN
jgi:hypothetical protein